MPCLFCQITDGDIPNRTVYETTDHLAFLDVNPLASGHTLVIPKTHYESVESLPDDTAMSLFGVIHTIVPAITAATDADATTIAFNNGEAAGQEVPHVHAHIVPRFNSDTAGPIHALFQDRPALSDDDLDDLAAAITQEL